MHLDPQHCLELNKISHNARLLLKCLQLDREFTVLHVAKLGLTPHYQQGCRAGATLFGMEPTRRY